MPDISDNPLLRVTAVAVVLLVLVAALAACQAARSGLAAAPTPDAREVMPAAGEPDAAAPHDDYWPTDDWRTADAATYKVEVKRLNAMMDYVKLKGLDILGIVVVRNGYVVFEEYGQNAGAQSRGEVYSVTKSFASTLVGIAVREGFLPGLDEEVLALLPGDYANVDERKQAMTLEDVLTMRSGLTWSEDDATISAFYSSADPTKFLLDRPMASEPGTEFNYCSGCSHLLTALVSKVTATRAQDFAQQELLGPLGLKGAYWMMDRNGVALGGWGLALTTREMAKLGYLFLRGGAWDGQEIVTSAWVEEATKKHTASNGPNGYGYQWWTHPTFPAYMALGRGGQIVYVNPAKDLVVAMRARLPNHDPIYYLLETYVEPAVRD